ncbi:MAG: hypothetical protein KatS3mg008_1428 [Acidimicrobiales bacterium]|nr:MAG: hypothetical protein KatS3mg008_1428 [Acidimicrobiales bacterium]
MVGRRVVHEAAALQTGSVRRGVVRSLWRRFDPEGWQAWRLACMRRSGLFVWWNDDVAEVELLPNSVPASLTPERLDELLRLLTGMGARKVRVRSVPTQALGVFLSLGFEQTARLLILDRSLAGDGTVSDGSRPHEPVLPSRDADEDSAGDRTIDSHGSATETAPAWRIAALRRRDMWDVLSVDHAAFPPEWRFSRRLLLEALGATPVTRADLVRVSRTGEAVAYAIWGLAGDRGYLQRLAVGPSHQRSGVATRLCTVGMAWLRANGASTVITNTYEENHGALAFYEKLGFSPTGRWTAAVEWGGRRCGR